MIKSKFRESATASSWPNVPSPPKERQSRKPYSPERVEAEILNLRLRMQAAEADTAPGADSARGIDPRLFAIALAVAITEIIGTRAEVVDSRAEITQDLAALSDEVAGLRQQINEHLNHAQTALFHRVDSLHSDLDDLRLELHRLLQKDGV